MFLVGATSLLLMLVIRTVALENQARVVVRKGVVRGSFTWKFEWKGFRKSGLDGSWSGSSLCLLILH